VQTLKQEGERFTLDGTVRSTRGSPPWLASILSLDGAIALAIFVAALIFNLHLIASTSLYFDEAMSVETARQSPGVLASYLWGNQNEMILYYVLLSAWLHLLNALGIVASEFLVRLPSIMFAALAVVVIYFLGLRFWGRAAGLIAAMLYMLSTLQLFHAQKARAYPLQLLLLAVSWYALLLILSGRDTRRRVWAVYVGATVLALYAQPYSALVLAAQVVAFAWYAMARGPKGNSARAALRSAIVALCAVVVLALPLAADFALHGQPNQFVPIAQLGDIPWFFIRSQLAVPSRQYAYIFAIEQGILVALAISASALWSFPRTSKLLRPIQLSHGVRPLMASVAYLPPGVAALAAWLLVPIAIAFLATQPYLNLHLFYWRYLVVVLPPLCLMVGIGASFIRVSLARGVLIQIVLGLTLLALVLPETVGYYAIAEVSDFRSPAAWLNAHYRAGDGIICFPSRQCSVPLEYYLSTYPGPAQLTSSSPGAWLWASQVQVSADPARVESFSGRTPRVFFVDATFGLSAAQLAQWQQERRWLDSHERLVAACTALTVTVRLYEAHPPVPGQADAPAPPC
jgi:mannosyltransferase